MAGKRGNGEGSIFQDKNGRWRGVITVGINAIGIILDLYTGLRLGELLGLTWENVDLKRGRLSVRQTVNRLKSFDSNSNYSTRIYIGEPKTEKSKRVIPLLDEIIKMLEEHQKRQQIERQNSMGIYQDSGFVLCNEIGEPLDPKTYQDFFKECLKKQACVTSIFMLCGILLRQGL